MINILPPQQKKVIAHLRSMRMITTSLFAAIVLVAVAGMLFLPTLQTINSRYTIALDQMHRLEAKGEVIKPLDITDLQSRIKTLKTKLAAVMPVSPLEYVQHIRNYETRGIHMTGYVMNTTDQPVMQIRGIADTREALQQLITDLQSDQTISSIDSPVSNFVKSTQGEFVITITFKNV